MVASTGQLEAERVGCPIVEGSDYVYIASIPAGCAGAKYHLHKMVIDVPTYQQKVLLEALNGKDAGMWFTCSLANFAIRYRQA